MKITDVQAILMSYPLPQPLELPFYNGLRTILKRDAMLIRVVTDGGLIGYAPGPAHQRAAREIRDVIRPFLIGKDPLRSPRETTPPARGRADRPPPDSDPPPDTMTHHPTTAACVGQAGAAVTLLARLD